MKYIIISLLFFIISCEKKYPFLPQLEEMQQYDTDKTIDLKKEINKNEKEIVGILNKQAMNATFYRNLGLAYIKMEMYKIAYDAFYKSHSISPNNPVTLFNLGLTAHHVSRSEMDFDVRQEYRQIAENSYLRALEKKPDYATVLDGITKLYAFDIFNYPKALEYADIHLQYYPKDENAKFNKAKVLNLLGKKNEAIKLYSELSNNASTSEKRALARTSLSELNKL